MRFRLGILNWNWRLVTAVLLVSLAVASFFFSAGAARAEEDDEKKPDAAVALRTPSLTAVQPMGGRPGAELDIELRGEFLDGAERVAFAETDVTAEVKRATFTRVQVRIRVAPDAQAGPRYFRLFSPRGVSNTLLFRVSEWPSVFEREPNDDWYDKGEGAAGEEASAWPVLISGRLDHPRDIDLFRFKATADHPLNLSLLSARNWSTADLSLAVLGSKGRAIEQDEGRLIWDPHLAFRPGSDGQYHAAVMLTRMPAGGQSRLDLAYQLAIGPVPLLLSAFPLYVQAGSDAVVEVRAELAGDLKAAGSWKLAGRPAGVEEVTALSLKAPGGTLWSVRVRVPATSLAQGRPSDDAALTHHAVPLALGHPSGLVAPLTVLAGSLPAISEAAGNDAPRSAQHIKLPVVINGRIESAWDEDYYTFEAQEQERLVFVVDTEKFGSRLDAKLSVLDVNGKTLASNDDARVIGSPLNRDPKLEFVATQAGTYTVRVFSLQRMGGEDFVYALTARRQQPGFVLGLGGDRVAVRRGDTAKWNVTVQREEGFQGEATVEVKGLPDGVTAEPLRLKGDQGSGSISLVASDTAPLAARPVEVSARAVIDGRERVVRAYVPAARVIGAGPGYAPYSTGQAWVAVVEPPVFSIESAANEVFLVRGGAAEFGVRVARSSGMVQAPRFALENAPDGVTVEKVEMIDQGRVARLTLRASETATVGRAGDVTVIGVVEHGGRVHSETAPRISVQVD